MSVRRGAPGREPDLSSSDERRGRYWRGVVAEWLAALWMILKGYRILARRWKSPFGEIDLVAVRGNTLVFVEVKHRASLQAAQSSISSRQRKRVYRAAEAWISGQAYYHEHEIRFDLVFIVPGLWPRHIIGGL